MSLTAKELCEVFAVGARLNYERDGHVNPCVQVLDAEGSGAVMIPHPGSFGGQPREQLASLVMSVADLIEVAFVVSITEAWSKAAPPGTTLENFPDIPRGQLQKEAETDPNIRTALMVQVIDVRSFPASYNVMATVKSGDPRRIEWDVSEHEGMMDGGLPDYLMRGYHIGRSGALPVDHSHTLEQRLQWLVEMNMLVAALAQITQPKPERN